MAQEPSFAGKLYGWSFEAKDLLLSSARAILGSLLKAHGEYLLDYESLLTVMHDTWFPPHPI